MAMFAVSHDAEIYALEPDARVSRLRDCAHYCRRLARQSDRPATIRSLNALAAEFDAQVASLGAAGRGAANDADVLVATSWQI